MLDSVKRRRSKGEVATNFGVHSSAGVFYSGPRADDAERRTHPKVAKVIEQGGYRASRTRMDLPVSKAIVGLMKNIEGDVVIAPTLGGSVPMYVFEDLDCRGWACQS